MSNPRCLILQMDRQRAEELRAAVRGCDRVAVARILAELVGGQVHAAATVG